MNASDTRLLIVSGLSGSGKSVALHVLEDLGYYCIDNMPSALLKPLLHEVTGQNELAETRIAVGVDARNLGADLENNFRSVLRSGLGQLDLVTREEFEVQEAVLAKTREKVEALEARLKELEDS